MTSVSWSSFSRPRTTGRKRLTSRLARASSRSQLVVAEPVGRVHVAHQRVVARVGEQGDERRRRDGDFRSIDFFRADDADSGGRRVARDACHSPQPSACARVLQVQVRRSVLIDELEKPAGSALGARRLRGNVIWTRCPAAAASDLPDDATPLIEAAFARARRGGRDSRAANPSPRDSL